MTPPPMENDICFVSLVKQATNIRMFEKEARSFRTLGFNVSVAATEGRRGGIETEVVDGIPLHRLPRSGGSYPLRDALRLVRYARSLRAQCYHLHGPHLLPFAPLLRWSKATRVVYDCMEFYPESMSVSHRVPPQLKPLARWGMDRFERLFIRFVDLTVVSDEAIEARVRSFFAKPVLMLHNFPKRSDYDLEIAAKRPAPPVKLVYTGGLDRNKGLFTMVEATRILRKSGLDVRLVLAGPMREDAELLGAWAGEGLVDYRGVVPASEIPAIVRECHIGLVLLQPVRKYFLNVPTKQFEYMASAIPFVGSDLPPIRRFVEESGAGLLVRDPTNPLEVAGCVRALIEDPDRAVKMGELGRRAFLEKFNWDAEFAPVAAKYAALLGLKRETRE